MKTKKLLSFHCVALSILSVSTVNAQEWVKPSAGRMEYIQDRTDCAQQGQKMALEGDELQKDVLECLAGKGWQRNQANEALELYCEEKATSKVCKRGATSAIHLKDRADCADQMLKTVGNQYARPGWMGLGGLIHSSMVAEENKKALDRAQLGYMKTCLEGKSWSVELRGEALKKMEQ